MKHIDKAIGIVTLIAMAGAFLVNTGCAMRNFAYTTTTTHPDGRVVVAEIKASVNSLGYDSSLEGFLWDAGPSNTLVRVDKHSSSGGSTNLAAVCATVQKGFDAVAAAAK